MWYIHAMEYYSPLKKEGHPDVCYNRANLEDVILREISQSQKDMDYMI
jgi:hypothetical protein